MVNVIHRIRNIAGSNSVPMIKGAFWTVLGSGFSRFALLLASIIIARILGKETFGEYGFIKSTILMFVVFGGDAIGLTASKFVSQYLAENLRDKLLQVSRFSIYTSFFTGLLLGLLVVAFSGPLSIFISNDTTLINEVKISGVIIIISSLNGCFQGILTGWRLFRPLAFINIGTAFFSLVLQVAGAWYAGLSGAIAGYGVSLVINLLMLIVCNAKINGFEIFVFRIRDYIELRGVFIKFSLPAALNGILIVPVAWLGNALLIEYAGTGEMGIYSAAFTWRNFVLMIPALVAQVSLPFLSGLHSLKNYRDYYKILKLNVWINFSVASIVAVIISLLSGLIMETYGESFVSGKFVLVVLMLSSILASINSVVGQALNSQGKVWLGVFFNFGWALAFLFFAQLFLWRGYGSMALALAHLIAYAMHTLWQSWYVQRSLGGR